MLNIAILRMADCSMSSVCDVDDDQFAMHGLDILSLFKATCFPWKKTAEKQIHIYHYLARVPSGKLT